MVYVSERKEEKSTVIPVVAETIKAGICSYNKMGRITRPPPMPSMAASVPAPIEDKASWVAIFGVIIKSVF